MKNVKDEVYKALLTVTEAVSDVYPKEWAEGSMIQFTEEDNRVFEYSGGQEGLREDKALVLFRIDIWDRKSTSATALAVDKAISGMTGLKRTMCTDVADPSGYKHKQMRYEGIIDMDSDRVYWR